LKRIAALGVGLAALWGGCSLNYDGFTVTPDGTGAGTTGGTSVGGAGTGGGDTGTGAAPGGGGTTSMSGGGGQAQGGGGAGAGAGGAGGLGGAGGAGGKQEPTDCAAILAGDSSAPDGNYAVDPDGPGGDASFVVKCDMTTEGGGWTRFHWLGSAFVAGTDPLGSLLQDCGVADVTCYGRIPTTASPSGLLVRDTTDDAYAVWAFDGSTMANAVLGALRDKVEVCITNDVAWSALSETSSENFCDDMNGGCDAFIYTNGNGNCNGATDWALELDDDGYYCRAAFKLGATPGGCGAADWGYLDVCDCSDEFGEMYYR